MKILIIGGTGLISTAFARQLVARGDDVTLLNRGRSENRVGPGAKVVIGDRRDYAAFEAQAEGLGTFDCVYDMVGFVPEDAESAVRAFRGRIGQLVFCSTVDVYSKPVEQYPYHEGTERNNPGSYGRSKALCEDILLAAGEQGDFAVTAIRPASTYGEGGTLVHTLGWRTTYFDRLRKGKPIVQHGDGNSLWVACHIEDVGRAFVKAAGNPKAFGRTYHVTGEEWMTWNLYHRRVAQSMGWPEPRIVHIPTDLLLQAAPQRAEWAAINFQFNNIYDNTAAHEDLGFRYTIPFVDGARRTITWLEERGRIEDCDADPFDDRLLAAWEHLSAGLAAEMTG